MKLPETFKHDSDIMFLFFEPVHKYWSWYEYNGYISKFIYYSPEFIGIYSIRRLNNYLDQYLTPRLRKYRP